MVAIKLLNFYLHIITKLCSFHLKDQIWITANHQIENSFIFKHNLTSNQRFMHIQTFFVVATECMDMWRNLNNFRRFDFENFIINLARCNVAIATNTPLILNKKYVHILFTRSSANSIKWTNTVNLCQMYNTTSLKSSLCQTDILRVIFFLCQ